MEVRRSFRCAASGNTPLPAREPGALSLKRRRDSDSDDDDYVPVRRRRPDATVTRPHDLPAALRPKRRPTRGPAAAPPPPPGNYPPDVAAAVAREEANLARMDAGSDEAAKTRLYLQWLKALPWTRSPVLKPDLVALRRCLDEDHYGLEDVKQRIVEEMALVGRTGKPQQTILCLVGPPGVGKTSIAKSIARARGLQAAADPLQTARPRYYQHCAVGGLAHEEALRGHHRAYIGATPGRILRNMRDAGCSNPVFVIDEVDKLNDDQGLNPVAAALLEILDPEQNSAFMDHFVDLPYDLSDVLFILTANSVESMHPALRDRCEIIRVPAYCAEDKIALTKQHLVPKLMKEACLHDLGIVWDDAAVRTLVERYTWEPGVRKLKQLVRAVCRKVAFGLERGEQVAPITEARVRGCLGAPQMIPERTFAVPGVGHVHGLYAGEEGGGGILRVVSQPTVNPGLLITGSLADSAQESLQIGHSFLVRPGGPCAEQARDGGLHVSFSDRAAEKEGPSAGITALVSMASAYLRVPVDHRLALTGELELDGHIAAVGGIPEKVAGAYRAGLRHVLIPRANAHDLEKVRAYTERGMCITLVETADEVLRLALTPAPSGGAGL